MYYNPNTLKFHENAVLYNPIQGRWWLVDYRYILLSRFSMRHFNIFIIISRAGGTGLADPATAGPIFLAYLITDHFYWYTLPRYNIHTV